MGEQSFDVIGIGNAIVDVISHADDGLLSTLGMPKGSMTLIDEARAKSLYDKMGPAVEISGGSVANSMAGLASLGGKAAYIGKVRNDQLGEVFAHDIRAAGVRFETKSAERGASTARCLILVTPDGQRTMNTYLGACVELGPEDIDETAITSSKIIYLEGYLWDPPRAKEAMLKAANLAHTKGRKVALSLSDAFCVDRHRAEFKRLIQDHVDVLFANESELLSLSEQGSLEQAIASIRPLTETLVVTRGAQGATVTRGSETASVPAKAIARVVDTTGAGDLFAAGFLFGYTRDRSLSESATIGAACAAEVISHYGARPEIALHTLLGG
jgi:sugar/nucleoside kinase (ribokinase family)